MFTVIFSFAIAMGVAIVLHGSTRRFVRGRLRYVDAVQKWIAPWVAGGAAFLVGALLVPFIPLLPIGIGTALTAALAVGSGVAAGVRDIRSGSSPIIYNP